MIENNKTMKLPELCVIMKENNLAGYSHKNKPELLALLREKGLIEPEVKAIKEQKVIDPKYDRLKFIRTNPRSVEITDIETGESTVFPSIYQASKAFGVNPKSISPIGKVWKKKYLIKSVVT